MADEEVKKENTGQEQTSGETQEAAKTESAASAAASASASAESSSDDNTIKVEGPEDTKKQESTADPAEESSKGFFGKKKDKEKQALKDQVASLQDQVKRQMAEFDNYRKRTDKEKDQMFSMGEKSVIEKILPIVDNFERGFQTVAEEDKDDAFVQGMQKIYQQLVKQMEDLGVRPIEAEGKDFDPNFHNAVMQVDSDKYESGKVAQELQKGYMFHDQVLRHSMVSVVR